MSDSAMALRKQTHKTIVGVSADIDNFHINKAVARLHELTNALGGKVEGDGAAFAKREAVEVMIKLIGPMMPHLAEEAWFLMGHEEILADSPWPKPDPALVVDETVTIALQVNGKLRDQIDVSKDISKEDLEAMALERGRIKLNIEGKTIRKVVVVPGRIVNVVAN